MIDKLRFKLSAIFLNWSLLLIPYQPVRELMYAGILTGIASIEEGMGSDSK